MLAAHANIGFFLETYAYVFGNDDRDAAEQAAGSLLGNAWDADDDIPSGPWTDITQGLY